MAFFKQNHKSKSRLDQKFCFFQCDAIFGKLSKLGQISCVSCVIPYYIQLTLENSNTQFLELFDSSNKFFGPFRHFFRQKNFRYLESRYLKYLGRSNKIAGPLDNFISFFRTFLLTFWPKFESSKFRTFYSIFW